MISHPNGDSGNETIKQVFLKVSEIFISDQPAVVKTILGSCVSITMFHPKTHLGAICHGMLPKCPDPEKCAKNPIECMQHVECSIWRMLAVFTRRGIRKEEIEVNLFGGAGIFRNMRGSIGKQNIETAKNVIRKAGLSLRQTSIGGSSGRKITFFPHTGKVTLTRISNHLAANIP